MLKDTNVTTFVLIKKTCKNHLYKEKNLEVTFDDVKIELTPEKSNRTLSVYVIDFFDYVTKQTIKRRK